MSRPGLQYLRDDLRNLTAAGTADWTAGTVTYFSDDYLDTILDKHSKPFTYKVLDSCDPIRDGAVYKFQVYEVEGCRNIEQSTGGTAVFKLQDYAGGTIPASDYSMDYRLGIMTLATPTIQNLTYFATGYSYDINGAAAEIFDIKAGRAASGFDFSTDNHSVHKSQLFKQYKESAAYYRSKSRGNSGALNMRRKDTDNCAE